MRRRADIQGLRALAVALVVLDHAGVTWLAGGFVGVDVFFVLSGYLITGLLVAEAASSKRVSIPGFYARRAKRILPAATLTLVVTAVAATVLLNFVRAKETLIDTIYAGAFVSNFRFASHGTDYFAQSQPPSPIQQFWSLSVEEQFYVVWPVLLTLLVGATLFSRSKTKKEETLRWGRLFLGLAVLVALSYAWSIVDTSRDPAPAYFSTFARAWELGLGALLAIALHAPAFERFRARPIGDSTLRVGGWLGLAMIVSSAASFSAATDFPGWVAILPTTGAALLIGCGVREAANGSWSVARIFSLKPLGYVGDRSYAMYLWHWPILIIAAGWAGHDLALWINLILVGVAFLVSMASYRWVENPLRRRRWTPSNRALYLWPASFGAVVLVVAACLGPVKADERGELVASAQAAAVEDLCQAQLGNPGVIAGTKCAPVAAPTGQASGVTKSDSGDVLPEVRVAAELAADPKSKFPSSLNPPPTQIAGDYYRFADKSCWAEVRSQTNSRICSFGAPGSSRTLVIFGDSHAQMWMPPLTELARSKGYKLVPLIKSGCSPIGWLRPANGDVACTKWFKWALAKARDLKPDVFLISGSYGNKAADSGLMQAMNESYSTAIAAFSGARGTKVMVMGGLPKRGYRSWECLLSSDATPRKCSDRVTPILDQFTPQLRTLSASAKASFLDPLGWFCYRRKCPLVIGNTVTYTDAGHVSVTYAESLSRPFANAFTTALNRAR